MSDSNKNEELLQELKKLNKQFESKIKYDTQKEKTIERLHSELQKYKQDLYKKMLLPIINDLIHFMEREERNIEFLKENPPSVAKLFKRFEDLFDDMRDLLYNQGIDAYKEDGDIFNPKRQKITKKIIINKIAKDKKIAKHKTWGYEWEGKIIKPEGVDIYVYEASCDDEKTDIESILGKNKIEPIDVSEDMLIKYEEKTPLKGVSDNEILEVIEQNIKEDAPYMLEMDFTDSDDDIFKNKSEFDELEVTSISSPKAKKNKFIEEDTLEEKTEVVSLRRKKEILEEETVVSSPKKKKD